MTHCNKQISRVGALVKESTVRCLIANEVKKTLYVTLSEPQRNAYAGETVVLFSAKEGILRSFVAYFDVVSDDDF